MQELILGGARSGKSTLALQRAQQYSTDVTYVATATAGDTEMQARIDRHRVERPAHWRTVECERRLAGALLQCDGVDRCIIVDCMTLWLSNVLWQGESDMQLCEQQWETERTALLQCLPKLRSQLILVSNEVGMSIVPDNAVARRFRDEQGWLNQMLAAACDRVTLVVAGIPLVLKTSL